MARARQAIEADLISRGFIYHHFDVDDPLDCRVASYVWIRYGTEHSYQMYPVLWSNDFHLGIRRARWREVKHIETHSWALHCGQHAGHGGRSDNIYGNSDPLYHGSSFEVRRSEWVEDWEVVLLKPSLQQQDCVTSHLPSPSRPVSYRKQQNHVVHLIKVQCHRASLSAG